MSAALATSIPPELAVLTEKQRKFVLAYVKSGNASDAARQAGYSLKTAHRSGQECLQKRAVIAALRALQAPTTARKILSAEEVLERLTVEALDPENPPADRIKALIALAKRYGLQAERVEIDAVVRHGVVVVPGPQSMSEYRQLVDAWRKDREQ